MTSSQPHSPRHGAAPVEHRRLDEAAADALRAYGGLGEGEHPITVVQIVETRGWDSDGRPFADFHVYATDGTTRRQAASLIRDGGELVARQGPFWP